MRRLYRRLPLILLCLAAGVWAQAEAASPEDAAARWATRRLQAKPLAVGAAVDDRGRLWLARVEGGRVWVSHSEDGRLFSAPLPINLQAEAIAADGENRPKIAVAADGTVHVTWTVALAKPYTGHVRYSHSQDGGASFSAPITVNDDPAEVSHRFDALAVDGARVVIAWLDGRHRQQAKEKGQSYAGAALYYAESRDGGASFGPNRKFADHSCECCRVALIMHQGAPLALWRQIYGENTRDFALARLKPGQGVIRASDDDWRLDGCPHHGGALSADAAGGLHLAWFTQGSSRQGLFYRRGDGTTGDLVMTPPHKFGNDHAQAGHPAVLATGREVTLAWREFDGRQTIICTQRSTDRGEHWGPVQRVAATIGAADYPLLLARDGGPWLLWNTADEGLRLQPLAEAGR